MTRFLRSFFCLFAAVISLVPLARAADVIESEKERFTVETVTGDLDHPWGMVKLPDGRFLVTERPGRLRIRVFAARDGVGEAGVADAVDEDARSHAVGEPVHEDLFEAVTVRVVRALHRLRH